MIRLLLLATLVLVACSCASAGPRPEELPIAWTPPPTSLYLCPRPMRLWPRAGNPLRLEGEVRIVAEPAVRDAGLDLAAELRHWWRVPATVGARGPIRLEIRPGTQAGRGSAEGYLLDIDESGVRLLGHDATGVWNGVQTLKQLIREDRQGIRLDPVRIRDWPDLPFRGAHVVTGARAGQAHVQLIERILGPLKLNALVVESQFSRWKSHPELWDEERSIPLEDLRRTVEAARARRLEPIPLIQSLSHAGWMFRDGRNRDLAADPATLYAYDPTDPRSWVLLLEVYREAIEIFRPHRMHIGHDEVLIRGRFPAKGTPGSAVEQIAGSATRLHDWLRQRGIGTMMWGDMLLHRSEAAQFAGAPTPADAAALRKALPRDILLADWQYNPGRNRFPDLRILRKAGFPVVGATWNNWTTIRDFALALRAAGGEGLLQTTWAGYSLSPEVVLGTEYPQFVGFVVAAEAAWRGGALDPDWPHGRPDAIFRRLWDRQPRGTRKPKGGFAVDLSPLADVEPWTWKLRDLPSAKSAAGRVKDGRNPAARALPRGRVTLEEVTFVVGKPVWLDVGSLEIPMPERPLGTVAFLWASTGEAGRGQRIAELSAEYEDGGAAATPLRYRRELLSLGDSHPAYLAPEAWSGRNARGERYTLRRWIWTNPHPERRVRQLRLRLDAGAPGLLLLAVTGIDP